jgi:hypothetical protein
MSLIKGSARAENLLSQLAQRYLGSGIVSKKKSTMKKKRKRGELRGTSPLGVEFKSNPSIKVVHLHLAAPGYTISFLRFMNQ